MRDFALAPLRRRLCAAPANLARRGTPNRVTDLLDHDCLVFITSGTFWEFETPQGLQGVEVRPKLRTNDGAALCQACIQGLGLGLGLAMVSNYLAAPALASAELVEVMPDIKFPDIWLKALVPLKRLDVPRIRILLQWLEHNLRLEQGWPASEAGAGVGAAAGPQVGERQASAQASPSH